MIHPARCFAGAVRLMSLEATGDDSMKELKIGCGKPTGAKVCESAGE